VNQLDPKAAQAALKVLSEKDADKNDPAPLTHTAIEPTETVSYNKSAVSIKQSRRSSILKSAIYGLKNCLSQVRFFFKPKRFITTAQR
jgi:hypothetical protein